MQIDTDTLRAALEGAVKPLEWTDLEIDRGDGHSEPSGDYEAPCSFGFYFIDQSFGSDSFYWSVKSPFFDDLGSFEDPIYAKAAAQADYTARILSAIDLDTLAAKLGGGE